MKSVAKSVRMVKGRVLRLRQMPEIKDAVYKNLPYIPEDMRGFAIGFFGLASQGEVGVSKLLKQFPSLFRAEQGLVKKAVTILKFVCEREGLNLVNLVKREEKV